jgi:ligand-binding SRPBCC domain-containing protein
MKTHLLEREQVVSTPLGEVFAFFARPENLAEITPPRLGFEILTPPPLQMGEGSLIDYTIRPFGPPMHWRTLITAYAPPHRFVDQQLKGPYLFWHHTHSFEAVEGGTRIRDQVRYLLPFGPLGRLVHRLLVRRQLEAIFDHRARVIRRRFGGR